MVRQTEEDLMNLSAEPDYRAVRLKWNYYNEHQGLTGFKVKFCEISAWNSRIRCRERQLRLSSSGQTSRKLSPQEDSLLSNPAIDSDASVIDKLIRLNRNTFEASIYDLRMLTNYTFSVKADFDGQSPGGWGAVAPYHPMYGKNPGEAYRPHTGGSDGEDIYRNVIVETKSFSAKTSRCLANTSDVVVNTGPYFSGKITVEYANDHRCSVYGNRTSNLSIYTLTILHDVCGSKIINNSRIETMVMVHENREILTHNSRRFLVVCNFVPETYTLTASVAVPTHLLKRKHKNSDDPHHTYHHKNHSFESNVIPVSKPHINTASVAANTDTNDNNNIIDKTNDIFTFDHYKQSHNVRDSRMLAQHLDHHILNSNPHNTNASVGKSVSDQYWNQILSTILFVISGLIFCVIALLWFATTPRLSDKNREIKSYVSMTTPSTTASAAALNTKLNKNKAILSVNGSPIALVSIDSLGESFA
ncbi:unnamed protein product [Medioppia subpectinata]|uniref:ZP domain-containing protein n=1 Tax=Medioppia subpectinata TaxID=1979941 RepID=A0A7R9KCG9_9ACAR|nr:unnamed protein product [Medioppia subpectinata]CAG2100939.1 unnamed protein product [Medioppia subpectinata]